MRIAIYARTSTTDQHPEAQLEPLRRAAAARGEGVPVEYLDAGVSGRRTSRPALDRLLQDCQAGRVGVLIIPALDRLGRRLSALAPLIEQLGEWGVQLVSIREGLDASTPTGLAMLQMAGVFAQLEASNIRERTILGLRAARARGARLGRPPVCPRAVAKARALIHSGSTVKDAARQVGLGYSTLRRALAA